MSDLYRIERFDPDSDRRFSGTDAYLVDFEEGIAVVPVESVGDLFLDTPTMFAGGVLLPAGRYALIPLVTDDDRRPTPSQDDVSGIT